MRSMRFVPWLLLIILSLPAFAAEDGGWTLVVDGTIKVKNRPIEGTPIKEVWAEGEIAAPCWHVQDALMDVEAARKYLPYVKDSRKLGDPNDDGSLNVYTLIDLPLVGKRDYIQRISFPEKFAPDGSGTFRAQWVSQPTFTPKRAGVVRVESNTGSWVITRLEAARCHAVYKFTADPGGWIPPFLANMGNEKGVRETYEAVQREALRRAALK
jgi:hypothetical protein